MLYDELGQAMRVSVVADDKLVQEALRATGLKTKRAAVELGLRTLLRLRGQEAIRRLRGRLEWQGDLDEMRRKKTGVLDDKSQQSTGRTLTPN